MNEPNIQTRLSSGAETRTSALLHWTGYGLLVLALLDFLETVVPPGFMNPVWELQFMGASIERSPVALLGFMLVFYGEWARRAWWERWVLPGLSWAALAVGAGFLLMIPLLVANTFRVDESAEKEINVQLAQQITQAKALQDTLTSAQGDNLESLLRRAGKMVDGADADALRKEMLAELSTAERELQQRANESRASDKLELHKRTYKHVAQTALVGTLLVLYWFGTGWARKARRKT